LIFYFLYLHICILVSIGIIDVNRSGISIFLETIGNTLLHIEPLGVWIYRFKNRSFIKNNRTFFVVNLKDLDSTQCPLNIQI